MQPDLNQSVTIKVIKDASISWKTNKATGDYMVSDWNA